MVQASTSQSPVLSPLKIPPLRCSSTLHGTSGEDILSAPSTLPPFALSPTLEAVDGEGCVANPIPSSIMPWLSVLRSATHYVKPSEKSTNAHGSIWTMNPERRTTIRKHRHGGRVLSGEVPKTRTRVSIFGRHTRSSNPPRLIFLTVAMFESGGSQRKHEARDVQAPSDDRWCRWFFGG